VRLGSKLTKRNPCENGPACDCCDNEERMPPGWRQLRHNFSGRYYEQCDSRANLTFAALLDRRRPSIEGAAPEAATIGSGIDHRVAFAPVLTRIPLGNRYLRLYLELLTIAASIDPEIFRGPLPSAPNNRTVVMKDIISTNKDALKVWLVDLSGNIAVSDAGIALLDAQITHLESDYSAVRNRIDHNEPRRMQRERSQQPIQIEEKN
jgi:hypothetical protein